MRRARPGRHCVLLAFALCMGAARVSAHAPLPRGVAVSPTGAAIALELPGFGLLVRSKADSGFAYTCDALLGVPLSDLPAALQYFDDQTLLVGSPGGLRVVAANGCPLQERHPLLGMSSVSAVAIHPITHVAYVIAAGLGSGVWRSSDRGVTWERRGSIEAPDQVTGLAIDPEDATKLYLTRTGPGEGSVLLVSGDAGRTFASYPQERALRLLAVQAAPLRLWAVARALDSVGNRGFEIVHASDAQAPWTKVLRVNYFGGLTIARDGVIWVGDEGGGVHRSTDAGATFTAVDARSRVACLASAGDAVWACTPDLPAAPALKQWDGEAAFRPAVAFADVEQLVTCGADVDVAAQCEGAWIEWQRDVLMKDLTMQDAGATQPSGAPAGSDAGAQQPPAAGASGGGANTGAPPPMAADTDAGIEADQPTKQPQNSSRQSGSCSAVGPVGGRTATGVVWLLVAVSFASRARRDSKRTRER